MNKKKPLGILMALAAVFLIAYLLIDWKAPELYLILTHQNKEAFSLADGNKEEPEAKEWKVDAQTDAESFQTIMPEELDVLQELTFQIKGCEQNIEVGLWQNEAGEIYLFLPGFAKGRDLIYSADTDCELTIEGYHLFVGDELYGLEENVKYTIKVTREDEVICQSRLEIMYSSDLPVISIALGIGTREEMEADKENYVTGQFTYLDEQGNQVVTDRMKEFKGRGNSTWGLEKKPFQVELAHKTSKLGFQKADSYNLLANGYDDTNLRNKIVLDMAKAMDFDGVPGYRMVDLYIDGVYEGNYYITEKVNQAALLGKTGVLFHRELESRYKQEPVGFMTYQGDCYVIEQDTSEENVKQIAGQMQELQDALETEDGIHPKTGRHYTELIDLDSFVKKYLVEEVSKNYDGGVTSSYFHVDKPGGVISAGPVWDYDVVFGNCNLDDMASDPKGITKLTNHIYSTDLFARLYEQPEFYQAMVACFENQVLPYLESLLQGELKRLAYESEASTMMDYVRWESLENRYRYYDTYDNNIRYLEDYIQKRITYLKEVWLQNVTYHQITFVVEGMDWQKVYVKDGELPELIPNPTWNDKNFIKWINEQGVSYDFRKPVYEDMEFYALWQDLVIPEE